jgi:hypothetical protein
MAEYDLTHRLSKFLDRHLVFPLLEFLSARGMYDPKSIQVMEGKGESIPALPRSLSPSLSTLSTLSTLSLPLHS